MIFGNMLKTENLIKIIKLGIYLALLAPLVYIPQTIFSTVFGKMVYFQIIVELALPFFLYLIFFHKEERPKIDILTKLILLFFGVIFIASMFGVDFKQSFWGYPSRMRGIFTLLHLLFLYFYIITAFRSEKERKNLILFVILIGFAMAVFGFIERINPNLGIDKSSVKNLTAHRVMSTTGNPIFLGGFLLFIIFFSAYYFLKNNKFKYFILAGALLSTLVLFYTGTRAAFLGLIAGIFLLLFYLFLISTKKKKIIAVFVIFLSIIFSIILFYPKSDIQNKYYKYLDIKQLTEFSLKDGSISGRLLLWQLSLPSLKERRLLGRGLENFNYAFDKYYNPSFLKNGVNETFSDRAHNIFIDIAIMAGAFGLLSFLAIFAYSAFSLLKNKYRKQENAAFFGLLGAISAYIFFAVDSPEVNIMLFFFFALLYFVFHKDENCAPQNIQGAKHPRVFKFLSFCIFVFLVFCIFIFYNIKPLSAGIDFIKYKHAESTGEMKLLAENFLKTPIYQKEFGILFGNHAFYGANQDSEFRLWEIDKAIEFLKIIDNRDDFSNLFLLGNLYLRKGSIKNSQSDYQSAIEYYKQALEASPKRQPAMFQMATAYILSGSGNEAIEILKKAMDYDDKIGQSHWRLGIAYLSAGDEKNAYKEFKKSAELEYFGAIEDEMLKVASLCEKFKDEHCILQEIIVIYGKRIEQDPSNLENKKMLINAFIAIGDYESAKRVRLDN